MGGTNDTIRYDGLLRVVKPIIVARANHPHIYVTTVIEDIAAETSIRSISIYSCSFGNFGFPPGKEQRKVTAIIARQ
jgi:hypothetical protein